MVDLDGADPFWVMHITGGSSEQEGEDAAKLWNFFQYLATEKADALSYGQYLWGRTLVRRNSPPPACGPKILKRQPGGASYGCQWARGVGPAARVSVQAVKFRASAARLLLAMAVVAANVALAQPIQRSQAEVRAFRAENPCPATGRVRGACPGWQVDHPKPLCAGGLDHRSNMAWLSLEDHKWKTFVDARECRKFRRLANTPARER